MSEHKFNFGDRVLWRPDGREGVVNGADGFHVGVDVGGMRYWVPPGDLVPIEPVKAAGWFKVGDRVRYTADFLSKGGPDVWLWGDASVPDGAKGFVHPDTTPGNLIVDFGWLGLRNCREGKDLELVEPVEKAEPEAAVCEGMLIRRVANGWIVSPGDEYPDDERTKVAATRDGLVNILFEWARKWDRP